MTIKLGINGFGRIGRLALRVIYEWQDSCDIHVARINDPAGDAETMSHLLNFDSVHGRFKHTATAQRDALVIGDTEIVYTQNSKLDDTDWSDCDIVLEASGRFRQISQLQTYLNKSVKRVVVSAPVKDEGALNIVMGVNDDLYNPGKHRIVTAASCTTNCLAPVVKVIHNTFGIRHGSITTIHDITNTQTILDAPHKDLRRARACGISLIPTSTGSATAITDIFPELRGKLDGHAVRVPLANASLTDCVFEVEKATSTDEVNNALRTASEHELKDILGYEDRPLVSVDYRGDPRSGIVDALSTMVVNDTQVKSYVWYDNEWGYANRVAELIRKIVNIGV